MARRSRDARILGAVERVIEPGERIVARGRCWAAARRRHVPVLLLGRHQYDVVLTDRRVMLFSRRRRRLRADDVALVKRFGALSLDHERRGIVWLQHRIHTDTGAALVVEWRGRDRRLGQAFAHALTTGTLRT